MSIKKKILVLCSGSTTQHNLFVGKINFKNYDEIYGFDRLLKKYKFHKKTKLITVPENIISVRDFFNCDHKAAIISEKVFSELVKPKDLELLYDISDNTYAKFLFKKIIMAEIASLYRAIQLSDKVKKRYNITSKVEVYPEKISFQLLKFLIKNNIIENDISFPKWFWFKLFINQVLKFLFVFPQILFFPEFILTKMLGKHHEKQSFLLGYNLYEGQVFNTTENAHKWAGHPDFLINNKKIFSKDIIYVVNQKLYKLYTPWENKSELNKWIEQTKKAEPKVIDIKEIIIYLKKKYYLKNYYKDFSKLRWKLIKLSLVFSFNIVNFYKAQRSSAYWKIFYYLYNVKNFITSMVPGDLTTDVTQSKMGSKTFFVYHSSHGQIIRKKFNQKKSDYLQLSHMIYDKIASNKLSNKYFSESENKVKEYFNAGVMLSDQVHFAKKNLKEKIIKNLNISKEKKVITFFDSTVGYRGIQSINSFKEFCGSIIKLSEKKKECFFILKCKNTYEELEIRTNREILNLLDRIKNLPNCSYLTDYSFKIHKHLTTHNLIGASDLVISGPMSSLILDSICGNIKTIIYDPDNEYSQDFYISTQAKLFRATSHTELENLVGFWLDNKNNQIFYDLLNKYIKPNIDSYCDGKSIDRFRDYIKK